MSPSSTNTGHDNLQDIPSESASFSRGLPIVDLTAEVRIDQLPPIVGTSTARQLQDAHRALFRSTCRNLMITGAKGVGKTTFVRNLARDAVMGETPFLKAKRFVWINCQNVAREDSRACLESLLHMTLGQKNLILCLDGFSSLLRRTGAEDNKPLLKSALSRIEMQVIAVMSKWEFNDLIASDADMVQYFTRIEIDEPHGEALVNIVRAVAKQLEAEFAVNIPEATIQRVLTLCSSYILNEQFPLKAAQVLRQVCEDLDFERTQRSAIVCDATPEMVIQTIATLTGVPMTTLRGEADQPDFESALSSTVFGQPEAVATIASELRLIKAGLVDSAKPATVLLFAGMTGVGKTELAKQVAELYSTSRRLQTYPMGNFTEPHSVSGIIGVPPGYVGHEQGGRIVNDLNSDPYSVFLLDEGDKAHPNTWMPFLNLFDEGWITDQRGQKAYADRSIFIITTNAGADTISQMSVSGKSTTEIENRVRTLLSRIRHERSSQTVFTPQFLARIKKIVVFRPLDAEAMQGICLKQSASLKADWLRRRDKILEIDDAVLKTIAEKGHLVNAQSGGREGGRIIRKLLSEFIESRIQSIAIRQGPVYKRCRSIRVKLPTAPELMNNPDSTGVLLLPLDVLFEGLLTD